MWIAAKNDVWELPSSEALDAVWYPYTEQRREVNHKMRMQVREGVWVVGNRVYDQWCDESEH